MRVGVGVGVWVGVGVGVGVSSLTLIGSTASYRPHAHLTPLLRLRLALLRPSLLLLPQGLLPVYRVHRSAPLAYVQGGERESGART